jgi:hypothetical protein
MACLPLISFADTRWSFPERLLAISFSTLLWRSNFRVKFDTGDRLVDGRSDWNENMLTLKHGLSDGQRSDQQVL